MRRKKMVTIDCQIIQQAPYNEKIQYLCISVGYSMTSLNASRFWDSEMPGKETQSYMWVLKNAKNKSNKMT